MSQFAGQLWQTKFTNQMRNKVNSGNIHVHVVRSDNIHVHFQKLQRHFSTPPRHGRTHALTMCQTLKW